VGDSLRDEVVIASAGPDAPILTITGQDVAIKGLTIRGDDSFVLVTGGAPTFEDLTFDGVGMLTSTETGCHATFGPGCNPVALRLDGTDARLIDSVFTGSGEIDVVGGGSPSIEGNDLSGGAHVFLEAPGDDTVVRGNEIHDMEAAGVVLFSTGRPLIEGNVIRAVDGAGIEVGLQLAPGIEPIIRGNTISGSGTAIQIASGALPTIEANVIRDNASGITLAGSDPDIARNDLSGNGSGVFIMRGAPTLEANTITGGKVGLGLGSDAATPVLVGNTICGNETNINATVGAPMPATEGNEICADEPAASDG
jgi:parallel beta-helix repeat protein